MKATRWEPQQAITSLDEALAYVDELKAEIERLRAALQEIDNWLTNPQMGKWAYMEGDGFWMDLEAKKSLISAALKNLQS